MKSIVRTDRVRNDIVLKTVKEDWNIVQTIKIKRLTGFVTCCFLKHVIEGKIEEGLECGKIIKKM